MTNDKNEIRVEVNGSVYKGWLSAQVVSAVTQMASQFALSVTEKYPGGSMRIRPGDKVTLKIGSDVVLTGFVDSVPINYNGSSITTTINGRSRTLDIIDCCIDTSIGGAATSAANPWAGITTRHDGVQVAKAPAASEWTGIDIKATIASLCAPYGVKVYDRTLKSYVSKKVSVSKGTTVNAAIQKLIEEFNLFVTDTESGDLILSESLVSGKADDALVCSSDGVGTNILEGSSGFDYSDVYSEYEVFGQARPQDSQDPSLLYNVSGKATSTALKRTRTLRIFESGDTTDATCQKRAAFEAEHRAAQAQKLVYRVAGWRQSSGRLWKKGHLVEVRDDILRVNENMMIESVTFDMSESGQTTSLALVRVESGFGNFSSIANAIKSIGASI